MTYIGIDISKKSFDTAQANTNGTKRYPNTPEGHQAFIDTLNQDQAHVVMEATGKYSLALALALYEQKIKVSVVNPARIKRYAQSQLSRVKTDKEDAKLIAHFAQTQQPKAWTPPSPTLRKLQEWHNLQSLLKTQREQIVNQQEATSDEDLHEFQQSQINQLDEQLSKIEKRIKKYLRSDDKLLSQVQLLNSIPGVADATAIKLLISIRDITDFQKAKQLVSFLGIAPQIQQSGSSLNRSKMSKMGNPQIRKMLYMPTLAAIRSNPSIKAFSDKLKARGFPGKKRVIASMRKLIHIVFAVLKHGNQFNPNYKMPC